MGGDQARPPRRRSSPHGGTITHHHAVGRDHRPWYDRQRPEPFASALRGGEGGGRSGGIMNPGVLIDPPAMKIAVLGPGGVGGLLAGVLERAGSRRGRRRPRVDRAA